MKKITLLILCCFAIEAYSQCYTSISSKKYHNLAIKPDGTLWAWGGNSYYQLGNNSNADQPAAIQIGTANNWSSVYAGTYWSLALKNDGTLWAWGRNDHGQTVNAGANTPHIIGTDSDWAFAAAGESFGAAIKTDGTLWMWGDNTFGQLGNGTTNNNLYTPTKVGADNDWIAVSLGTHHTLALKSNGTLWAWGQNDHGDLGIGNFTNQSVPVQVGTSSNWVKINAGNSSGYAIKTDGTLWAWGSNLFGEVGDGSISHQSSPVQVGSSTWQSVSATHHVLAIQSNGTLWSWGWDSAGQVGDGTPGPSQSVPIQVGADSDWSEVVCGWHHSLAVKNDGTLWSWGDNHYGTLGDGAFTDNVIPEQVGFQCDQVLCTLAPGMLPIFASECIVTSADLAPPAMTDSCGNIVTPTLMIGSFPLTGQATTTILWQYNTSSGPVTALQDIIINDVTDPVVAAHDISVDLQGDESVSILPQDIDNGSSDNCTLLNLSLDVDTFTEAGTYTVILTGTDNAGNQDTASAIVTVIDSTLGDDIHTLADDIIIHPVPVKEWLTIKKPEGTVITLIEVYDITGRVVYSSEGDTDKINLSKLSGSGYWIKVRTNNGSLEKAIIKQ